MSGNIVFDEGWKPSAGFHWEPGNPYPVADHEMKRVDSGVLRCRCGWGPTYNKTTDAKAAEVRAHLQGQDL